MVDIKIYKKSKDEKTSVVVNKGAASNQGGSSSHTHANKNALDAITIDNDGYEYLTMQKEVVNEEMGVPATQTVKEKVKAGYADKAGHARRADIADEAEHARRAEVADDLSEDSPANERFIRKDRADRTPYLLSSDAGFEAGRFIAGASGAAVDRAGNAEVESIVVRSFMKVFELIYNRLNALEGDTSFADSGTIESITDNGDETYTAEMRPRWEGDFTSFQPGDIVYGYVNDLRRETPEGYSPEDNDDYSAETPALNGYVYYKAWAYVREVDRGSNTLTLVRYPDGDVPAKRNFPMRADMLISRWGNNVTPCAEAASDENHKSFIVKRGTDENPIWVNTRQQSFYISCEGGNIVELTGVDAPILKPGNYGTVLGQLPEGLARQLGIEEHVNPGQPYLYARGIIVQDLIRISYQGKKLLTPYYRGEWDKETAQSEENYYRCTDDSEDWVTYRGVLYHYISNEATALSPEEDKGLHWGRITDSVEVWQIVPSVDKINIRDNGWSDRTVEVTVRMTSPGGVTDITTPEELDAYGKELVFSLDGVTYNEFWVRQGEQIEETGLDRGGNNIPWMEVTDRILLTLRNKTTHDEATTFNIPIIKDGEDGQSIKGDKGEDGKDGKDGESVEMRYRIFTGFPATEHVASTYGVTDTDAQLNTKGWRTTYGPVNYGDSLWQITAMKDGDRNLIGEWSAPVALTGQPGADGVGKRGPIVYPAGLFDRNTVYTSTEDRQPYVQDGEIEGLPQYYILKPEMQYFSGGAPEGHKSPKEDATSEDGGIYWEHIEGVRYFFADILMSNFAKLNAAVFWGNLMMSQKGVTANGEETYQYDKYGTSEFTPNFMVDFYTGNVYARDFEFYGVVRQKKCVITWRNYERYLNADKDGFDWERTGTYISLERDAGKDFADKGIDISKLIFELPDISEDYTEARNDRARCYNGSTYMLYNRTGASVYAYYWVFNTEVSEGVSAWRVSVEVKPGQMISLRSVMRYKTETRTDVMLRNECLCWEGSEPMNIV